MTWVRILNPNPAPGAVGPFKAKKVPNGWQVVDATGKNVLEVETSKGRELTTTHKTNAQDLAKRWTHGRTS